MEQIALFVLYAFVFSLSFEDIDSFDFGSISRLIGLLAMGAGTFAILDRGYVKPLLPFHYLFAAFITWALLSYQWSIAPAATFTWLMTLIQLWLFTFLVWQIITTLERLFLLMAVFVLSNAIVNIMVFVDFLQSGSAVDRYVAMNANENRFSFFAITAIAFALFLFLKQPGRIFSILCRLYIPLGYIAIILSGSRGGSIASLPILIFIILSMKKTSKIAKAQIILVILLVIAAIVYVIPADMFARIESIPEELTSGTLGERRLIWESGFDPQSDVWFLGTGYNTFREHGMGRPSHNTWLSLLVSVGIPSIGLFAAMLLALVYSFRRLPSLDRRFWLIVLLSWFIYSQDGNLENAKLTWLLFALMATYSRLYAQR